MKDDYEEFVRYPVTYNPAEQCIIDAAGDIVADIFNAPGQVRHGKGHRIAAAMNVAAIDARNATTPFERFLCGFLENSLEYAAQWDQDQDSERGRREK